MSEVGRRRVLQWAAACALAGAGGRITSSHASSRTKSKVIIVGGGFAGGRCALALRRADPAIEVTLIDPDARYMTCPMSNSVVVGLRPLQSLAVSRAGLQRAGVQWIQDRVAVLDAQRRRVRLACGTTLAYDALVFACGIRFLWGKPLGYDAAASAVMPHAWRAGGQTELLARRLMDMRDGGVVAISVPAGPMRCPPGPFERASLIADYLKQHKPRSKVLIFDANNHFPKQDSFNEFWREFYPGMIEWIPVVSGGTVTRVDTAAMTLYTSDGAHRVDVANIIPPQAPEQLAVDAGLAAAHGWCPVRLDTFESTQAPGVHVIGDACIADPMPKSASAASSQALQCALSIAAALNGHAPPEPRFDSVCYSLLGPDRALAIRARFGWSSGAIERAAESGEGGAEPEADAATEARNADAWYRQIVATSFGGGAQLRS